jgi:hypothetical protein
MSDDKITQLPIRAKNTRVLKVADRDFRGCKHLNAIVDDQLAELTCSDCGVKLNPIAFLVSLAHKLTTWDWETKQIAKVRAEYAERKKCRCTKCGEWTEIRRVGEREVARIKSGTKAAGGEKWEQV